MAEIPLSACSHCQGSGYCTRPGCDRCEEWRDQTESSECGACCGTGVLATIPKRERRD